MTWVVELNTGDYLNGVLISFGFMPQVIIIDCWKKCNTFDERESWFSISGEKYMLKLYKSDV